MKEEITFTMGLRGGTFRECHPRYSELSVEYSREDGEMAFGQKLSGTLKFIDTDYDWIMSQDRGVEILVRLNRSGIEFFGKFVITDCEIDEDNRKIEVELEADDAYSWLKAHLDDTFNLVGLAPRNEVIEYRRRGCWQYYRQGDKKLTAIMGGDYFEMDATQTASYADLTEKYYFNLMQAESAIMFVAPTDAEWRAQHADIVAADGKLFEGISPGYLYCKTLDGYRVKLTLGWGGSGNRDGIRLAVIEKRGSSGAWASLYVGGRLPAYDVANAIAYSYAGTGGAHYESFFYYGSKEGAYFTGMYCRIVHNNAAFSPKYDLPTEDIVARTLNYNYVSVPSASMVGLVGTNEYSASPTEWGLAPDNVNYYKKYVFPPSSGITAPLYPVGKTTWGEYSWWAYFNFSQSIFDYVYWDTVQLKDAYPLDAVLNVLVQAIFKDSGYTANFRAHESFSEFFYGTNTGPVEAPPDIYITPKTNVLTANYSQRAQKGDITIGQVFDMLRDVFRCYWFLEKVDEDDYELRIENIYWFYNGGSYSGGNPYDIRNAKDPRTGKKWEYGRAKFKFDISELYKRYEFGWQDESTDWFDGDAVTCLAKYVNESATNKVKIEAFTSDLDYMLLSPEDFGKDGFALLGAKQEYLHGYGYPVRQTLKGHKETAKFLLRYPVDKDGLAQVHLRVAGGGKLPAAIWMRCYDGAGSVLIYSPFIEKSDGRMVAIIPEGTAYVSYELAASEATTVTAEIYLTSWLDRVEIPSSADDVAPQNYRLAFHYIERAWYVADYPCRNIAFGDGESRKTYDVESSYPVKKSMEQEVSLPWEETFDPYRGVLSTKGRALVNTYAINLLSLFQELTLRYGTDTK